MASVSTINNLGGHAHNPRGNLWFNDNSTYGHKLLMKMGWNKGKGLGKNENGITENLKVKFRSTNSGLGFKDDAYANVMKTEYESILKDLAAEYSNPGVTNLNKNADISNEKPVQKSKIVKSKLRYPKLFFGKDVTKYSEKDMKSIFICSTPLNSIEEKSKNTDTTEKKDFEVEQESNTYSSNLNISDYFAKKLEEKKNKTSNQNTDNINMDQQTALKCKDSETSILTVNKSATHKRKRKHSQAGNEIVSNDVEEPCQVTTELEGTPSESTPLSNKKLLRKRKKFEINFENSEVHSNIDEPCAVDNIKNEVLENSTCKELSADSDLCDFENNANQNSDSPKRKRKRSQVLENDTVESSLNTFPCKIELSLLSSKKKKKKKYSLTADQLSPEKPENGTTSEELHEKNKNCLLESTKDELSNNTNYLKKKKKSKRKLKEKLKSCLKRKCGSYLLKNVSFNETVAYRIIDSEIESVGSLSRSNDLDINAASLELTDNDENNSINDAYLEDKTIIVENNSDNICTREQDEVFEESDEESKLSHLPSNSSHYNAWVKSLKMQQYKKIINSIKKNKTLRNSNLLATVKNNLDIFSVREQDKALEKSDEVCKLSNLPSSNSTHYNSWIESQRQAMKMPQYQKILNNIKDHKILSTSNLLSIKGYGNWGFK